MKRVELVKTIEGLGCEFVRHGGKHDWYRNPTTRICQPVPRHREINEHLRGGSFGCWPIQANHKPRTMIEMSLPTDKMRRATIWVMEP